MLPQQRDCSGGCAIERHGGQQPQCVREFRWRECEMDGSWMGDVAGLKYGSVV